MEEKNRIGYGGGTHLADTELPAEFLLLPYGEIHYTRNGENGSFQFPEAAADTVIADFEARGKDLVIDYEHQSLGGCKAPAAGWIDRLFKTEQGLHAHVKYWTAEAAEYLAKGEYRYFSPTLYFDEAGNNVCSIHSVALTNHPALHHIPALAANDIESLMPLVLKDDDGTTLDDAGKIRLIRQRLELTERLEHELAALNAKQLVAEAFRDGKITAAEQDWAENFAAEQPEAVRAWCVAAPRRIPDNRNLDEKPVTSAGKNDETESRIFRMLGIRN